MSKPYPKEFRDDVVRVARNREPGVELSQIAKDFGIHFTTLYSWMKKADIEDGDRPGTTAVQSAALRDANRAIVAKTATALTLLDHLFRSPTVSVNSVAKRMGCTFPTASRLVHDFASHGWLVEMTGSYRNRLWRYQPYLELFHREALDALVGTEATPSA